MNQLPDMAIQYDQYFSSQLYNTRYPYPNQSNLAIIINETQKNGKHILDFGCGSGRYTVPLLEQIDANIVAYDISQEAISELILRCPQQIEKGRLWPVCGDLSMLINTLNQREKFDLAIMMFGVLGHIFSHAARQETLLSIRNSLRYKGRLIVTVPNITRRFFKQQALAKPLVQQGLLEPGDIYYHRSAGTIDIKMYYHLFTLDELTRDLEQAGFHIAYVGPESILPESGVVKSRTARWLDRVLTSIIPLRYAYGFLVIAEVIG